MFGNYHDLQLEWRGATDPCFCVDSILNSIIFKVVVAYKIVLSYGLSVVNSKRAALPVCFRELLLTVEDQPLRYNKSINFEKLSDKKSAIKAGYRYQDHEIVIEVPTVTLNL